MYRSLKCICVLLLLALAFVVLSAPTVSAHAILMESNPAQNATVTGPHIPITLRFNVRIDGRRSRLRLLQPDGRQILFVAEQSSPAVLQTQVTVVKPGPYK